MSGAFTQAAISRLASVTLGKMVQSKKEGFEDVEREYLRAAHIQPDGRLLDSDDQTMWFAPSELRRLDLRRGDVVVVEGGAGYGRSTHLDRDLVGWGFQNSIVRLRPTPGRAEGRFIDYALQAELASDGIAIATNLATIPHFTAEKIARYRISAPSVESQTAIANYLDRETAEIDAFIADQEQLIALLEERRSAVISAQLFIEASKTAPLKRYLSSNTGGTWGEDPTGDGDTYVLRSTEQTVGGGWDIADPAMRAISSADARRYRLEEGDLLVTKSSGSAQHIGKASLVTSEVAALRAVHSNFTQRLRPAPSIDGRFLWYLLASRSVKSQLKKASTTSTGLGNLTGAILGEIKIPIPSIEVQIALVDRLDAETASIDAAIADAREAIALSKERRAALISAAVTGRIDVAERKPALL